MTPLGRSGCLQMSRLALQLSGSFVRSGRGIGPTSKPVVPGHVLHRDRRRREKCVLGQVGHGWRPQRDHRRLRRRGRQYPHFMQSRASGGGMSHAWPRPDQAVRSDTDGRGTGVSRRTEREVGARERFSNPYGLLSVETLLTGCLTHPAGVARCAVAGIPQDSGKAVVMPETMTAPPAAAGSSGRPRPGPVPPPSMPPRKRCPPGRRRHGRVPAGPGW